MGAGGEREGRGRMSWPGAWADVGGVGATWAGKCNRKNKVMAGNAELSWGLSVRVGSSAQRLYRRCGEIRGKEDGRRAFPGGRRRSGCSVPVRTLASVGKKTVRHSPGRDGRWRRESRAVRADPVSEHAPFVGKGATQRLIHGAYVWCRKVTSNTQGVRRPVPVIANCSRN